MNSDQLYAAGKGTIAIMNSNKYPEFYKSNKKTPAILNLDNVGSGTHWVGVKPTKKVIKYQDSFGVPPPFHVKNQIVEFNPFVKQKPYQHDCGMKAFNFVV